MNNLRATLLLITALLWFSTANAMDYHIAPMGNNDIVIVMSGPIRKGDLKNLHAFIRNNTKNVHGLFGFALNSPGGDVLEAEARTQFVKKLGVLTIVSGGDLCASACFLLFAAGKGKIVHPRARIAVHSVSMNTVENPEALAATTAMARDAAALGVPAAIIGKMVTMPAEGIEFLSREDLQSMGAEFLPDEPDNTFHVK